VRRHVDAQVAQPRFPPRYTFVATGADQKLKRVWTSFWENATKAGQPRPGIP